MLDLGLDESLDIILLVLSQESLQISEVYKPLQDPLIAQCVKIIGMDNGGQSRLIAASRHILSKVFPKPRRAWMPTGCLVGSCPNNPITFT